MPRQTLRIRDDHDLRTVFECFDLDESGTVDVHVIPGDDPDAHVRGARAAAGAGFARQVRRRRRGSLDFSEFQALLQDYESPSDIWIEQTQEELGLVLPEPGRRPRLHSERVPRNCARRCTRPRGGASWCPATASRRSTVNDIRTRAKRRTTCGETVREQRVLITLEAPEPISSRGHHVPIHRWQHAVLVNTALVEDGETRLRRDGMRASSSNTTADERDTGTCIRHGAKF